MGRDSWPFIGVIQADTRIHNPKIIQGRNFLKCYFRPSEGASQSAHSFSVAIIGLNFSMVLGEGPSVKLEMYIKRFIFHKGYIITMP